jgi:hypothetical protein
MMGYDGVDICNMWALPQRAGGSSTDLTCALSYWPINNTRVWIFSP